MSVHHQIVEDYVRASGALLKVELSDDEMQAVQDMLDRISEKLPNEGDS